MVSLGSFLSTLQVWEGHVKSKKLIHNMPIECRSLLNQDLKQVAKFLKDKSVRHLRSKSRSNQSKGSAVEKYITSYLLSYDSERVQFSKAKGAGYPDLLIRFKKFPSYLVFFEIKATSDWNSKDSNRRVLFSSSKKMRNLSQLFKSTRYFHMIMTAIYNKQTGVIKNIRFDLLDPKTKVNVRLEASTSHKLLSLAVSSSRLNK